MKNLFEFWLGLYLKTVLSYVIYRNTRFPYFCRCLKGPLDIIHAFIY